MNDVSNLSVLRDLAATNQWCYLWPEIALVLLGLVLLAKEMVLPRRLVGTVIPGVAMAGFALIAALVCTPLYPTVAASPTIFSGMLLSVPAKGIYLFFLLASFLTAYVGVICLRRQVLARTEYFAILSFATAAILILARSNNFLMMFVALETVTVALYIMVGYARGRMASLEAALKYLIMGSFSSALLLFGIVMLYGAGALAGLADPLNYQETLLMLSSASAASDPLVLCGVALVLCGIAFKLGVVPFQIWVPDVYQGALTPTTAFLAVSSKAVGFCVLINLLLTGSGPFSAEGLRPILIPLLSAVAVLTILFGNLAALSQRNVKRLMGLSGVSHAGYLLMGVVAYLVSGRDFALYAIAFYLLAYLLASFAVFGVMAHVATDRDELQEVQDYRLLIEKRPFLAAVLFIGLSSLAGIPPMAGFIGKLLIFICAFQANLYGLLAIGIFGVVISIYYYFGWMRAAAFRPWRTAKDVSEKKIPSDSTLPDPEKPSFWSRCVLGALAVAILVLGLYQGGLVSRTDSDPTAAVAQSAQISP